MLDRRNVNLLSYQLRKNLPLVDMCVKEIPGQVGQVRRSAQLREDPLLVDVCAKEIPVQASKPHRSF